MDAAYDRTACRRTRLPLLLIFGSARPAMRHDEGRGDYPAGRDAPLLSPLYDSARYDSARYDSARYDSARVSVRRYQYLEGSRCRGAHLTLKGHAVVPANDGGDGPALAYEQTPFVVIFNQARPVASSVTTRSWLPTLGVARHTVSVAGVAPTPIG